MLTLLIKDFRLMFSGGRGGVKGVFKALLSLLFVAFFIGIEIFLFSAILKKIENYSNAPIAFMMLFLVIISAFMTVSGVFQAKKLFFNEQDINQLANHPVENSKMILSKLIFLVAIHYLTSLLFEYPIFIAYGGIFKRSVWFYYTALFYPLVASIFELGIALLLVYPVWMLLQYLKKHVLLEFILSVVLLFALVIPYSSVLNTFVGLVTNNELSLIFTEESIAGITNFVEVALPVNFLVDIFVLNKTASLFPYLGIAGGIFFFGLTITIFTFHRVRNITTNSKPKTVKYEYKKRSQIYGLIKKECILLTKNPDYIFSFSGLLLVQPFLLYLIVSAMNAIFSSGSFLYYMTLFPNFVALMDVFLVIMITLIINSGANQYIAIEERTIKNLKTIPVSYKTQLMIKMMIPYSLSAFFLLISVLVLLIGKAVTPITAFFSILLTLVVVFVFDVISLREELNIRHGKPRSSYLSTVFSYVLPFAYIALVMFLSYNGVSLPMMYLMGILLFAVLGLPQVLKVRRRAGDWFMELEAIN
ncbi:MAG: hypothetical protein E7641_05960 [Ruminococcaceae bacterium]|nr:hypothetical protein [Oscillospiraceae bacterium]